MLYLNIESNTWIKIIIHGRKQIRKFLKFIHPVKLKNKIKRLKIRKENKPSINIAI